MPGTDLKRGLQTLSLLLQDIPLLPLASVARPKRPFLIHVQATQNSKQAREKRTCRAKQRPPHTHTPNQVPTVTAAASTTFLLHLLAPRRETGVVLHVGWHAHLFRLPGTENIHGDVGTTNAALLTSYITFLPSPLQASFTSFPSFQFGDNKEGYYTGMGTSTESLKMNAFLQEKEIEG